ncbi:MAG: TIGR02757 family protein [Cyclobacteriaceae bacterium]|nr:TIGR02757 family protein [Cyclobacteriaceae bacterium]
MELVLHQEQIRDLLEGGYEKYNSASFIKDDPICVPHLFAKLQDIEIAGLFAAILAWGQRKTIIDKCTHLMQLFDFAPHDFILNHTESDLKTLEKFKHRTFNSTDLLYFVNFLQRHYRQHNSLETLFSPIDKMAENTRTSILRFHTAFTSPSCFPMRTGKHVASPSKKSACKRINMFLRWMVRKDASGVDFGLWQHIKPHQLVCPCDVHVVRIARELKLVTGKLVNWDMAEELTANLKIYDAQDPVKYDFALFGMGLNKDFY